MITRNLIFVASIITVLSACAEQQSQQMQVSAQEFRKYNCKQITKDMQHTSARYNQLVSGNKDDGSEVLQTALAAYAISQGFGISSGGEDPEAAYLKAKYDALQQVSIEKNCD